MYRRNHILYLFPFFFIAVFIISTSVFGSSQAGSALSEEPTEESPKISSAAIIENGGFEQPDVSSYQFFSGEVAGWQVTTAVDVEIIDKAWGHGYQPHSGDQLLSLNGHNRPGGIAQQISTESGTRYRLVFYVIPDPNAPKAVTLTATAGTSSRSYEVSLDAASYQRKTLIFEGAAGSTATRIVLTSTTEGTGDGPLIDDVSVEVIRNSKQQ